MAKLLLQIGCISTQLKIMAIFFSYALYEDDVDSHKRISSLFQNLVENCDSICSLIDLSRIRNKPFGDVVRRLLNIINVNSMTKVVSKRIKSLHFHDGGKMINTIPVSGDSFQFWFENFASYFTTAATEFLFGMENCHILNCDFRFCRILWISMLAPKRPISCFIWIFRPDWKPP